MFIEWCRSVRRLPLEGPTALARWRAEQPDAFAAAISAFVGLPDHPSVRLALLSGHPERAALIAPSGDGGHTVWSRHDLLTATTLPPPLNALLAALRPADLPSLAAHHLLDIGTTPDSRLTLGDPSDPRPLGAWLLGASLALAATDQPIRPRS
jgi:hypothetical protein